MFDRRSLLLGSGALAAGAIPRTARASGGRVIMATWGGGSSKRFRETFAGSFTKATGIPVTIAEVPDPAAVIAAAQGRPQHNVIIAASFQAGTLAQKGLLEELTEDEIPNIRKIPEQFWVRNAAGKLIGMPMYFLFYGIAYNTELAKAEDFPSWKVLAEPRWKDKISITRPVFLAPYDLTLYAKLNGGDETNIEPGIPMLRAVAKNAGTAYTSMASLQQQLATGEIVAAPYYSGQIQNLRQAGQTSIAMTLPADGGLALSYMLAVPKGAPDRAAAIRFLNEAIDPQKQLETARSGFLPLTTTTLPPDIERDLGTTVEKVRQGTWSPNWFTIAEKFEERVRLVERIITEAR
ncbi:extracellular solute-binding protein [Enterovirga rhinocerotis]|uniref:Putative spermidine/putrescine transport system substrate-binding protein n=1 Tax=Enterovirga rhinocerotis TaxID=1339210 RepID=A0A4R7BWI0_9HYPH|nr:extracellular solute-binding protein [Enterovirga rhinocerotis]TDR90224.1 putative spermidine/putrescine transport system substrate-binding protein [Enterovirga rhinocerotis]